MIRRLLAALVLLVGTAAIRALGVWDSLTHED